MSEVYWGVDLGGTKIEAVVIDGALKPICRRRIATEAEGGYSHILERISTLLDRVSRESGFPIPERIGIGTPGRYDAVSGRMKNSNTVALNGRDLKRDLEHLLHRELLIENDANCFALAESMLGCGAEVMRDPSKMAFGIILGTGVGGGIVCHGRVRHGAHGIAGEWGHNELLPDGEACYCGRRGCVETVISGPALERYYKALTGSFKPLSQIASDYGSDSAAAETIERLLLYFGKALARVINILDPDLCIIGGGVGQVEQLYSPEARSAIERHLFNSELRIPILKPLLGDSAGVFGAALLARTTLH
ncbi:ROK family protein [Chlorobium ferrooxidans]|uniref:ROK family protein n=1 Tax=Chlorobium ferrooxidans TaxID=84205 RepID=UPI0012EAB5BE|nr:ROK family protein [Chlorobium ferrooxidans]